MDPPPGAPDWLEVCTAAERPDLWEQVRTDGIFYEVWPEYNQHGLHAPVYFGALIPRFAEYQFVFVDRRSSRAVGRGRTIPFRWDGTLEDLPDGIDAVGLRAVHDDATPTALSALAAEILPEAQGSGLSSLLLATMASIATAHGLGPLLAPVRPSRKDRFPLTPIEQYARWRRPDGLPLDPWLRVHARLGGRILRTEPRSMRTVAPVGDWETWTGTSFPADGRYVFPGGLAPLEVRDGQGEYFEPNVWLAHEN
ncbi:MAG: GNAT family N-acetyltransferase [Acidimicrobiales bacterium]